MTTKNWSAWSRIFEVDLVEALVDVEDHVVVQRAEVVEDLGQVLLGDQLGRLGRRRREEQVDPRVVMDQDLLDEVGSMTAP
jgi:photosystem II stability/assembly factor-like uncharacterized protein